MTKTFYLVNPLAVDSKKQDKFQEFFLKKWITFSKNNLLLNEYHDIDWNSFEVNHSGNLKYEAF